MRDKVPPHDNLILERLAANQQHAAARRQGDVDSVAAAPQVGQLIHLEGFSVQGQVTLQHQHPVFECCLKRQCQLGGALGLKINAHQRREAQGGCVMPTVVANQKSEVNILLGPAGQVGVVVEARRRVSVFKRQRDPQLGGMQLVTVLEALFGMADAMARGHQIDLARPDDLITA